MRVEWSGWLAFGIVWVLTLAPGFALLWAYKMRPGEAAGAPDSLLRTGKADRSDAPVYGCSLRHEVRAAPAIQKETP